MRRPRCYDVALLDLHMPGLDGWEVVRRLRREGNDGEGRPFLVALSGYCDEAVLARSREAGFDLHLAKPAEPAHLRELLAGLSGPSGANGAGEATPPSQSSTPASTARRLQ